MEKHLGRTIILDTNILMGTRNSELLFNHFKGDDMVVTLGTVKELDRLKGAEGRRGFEARSGLRILRDNPDKIKVLTNDTRIDLNTVDGDIIDTAANLTASVVTNDLSMKTLAESIGIYAETFYEPRDSYRTGFKVYDWSDTLSRERDLHKRELSIHLPRIPMEEVRVNEYAIIELDNMIAYTFKREANEAFTPIEYVDPIASTYFGGISAKSHDPAQLAAFDMIGKQPLSLLTGPAGSGKTLIMLAKQFEMLEKGEITKITVFVNPEKARGAKELGFYKGDRDTKLLQESIGGILASKLGEKEKVLELLEDGVLDIVPVSDIRGYEVADNSSLYITEAQNLTVDLMQLALQRAGDGVKVFVEGDPTTQLDSWMYEGDNNGMLKLIEVFSGREVFAGIQLDKIYRSEIASIADLMTK